MDEQKCIGCGSVSPCKECSRFVCQKCETGVPHVAGVVWESVGFAARENPEAAHVVAEFIRAAVNRAPQATTKEGADVIDLMQELAAALDVQAAAQ